MFFFCVQAPGDQRPAMQAVWGHLLAWDKCSWGEGLSQPPCAVYPLHVGTIGKWASESKRGGEEERKKQKREKQRSEQKEKEKKKEKEKQREKEMKER